MNLSCSLINYEINSFINQTKKGNPFFIFLFVNKNIKSKGDIKYNFLYNIRVRVMPKVIKQEDNAKRDAILEKILEILGKKEVCFNKQTRPSGEGDTDVTFFLSKMDIDEEAQNRIYELEQEIKKYYVCSKWTCFNKEKETKRKWLSMIKYICKEHERKMDTGNIKYADGKYDTVYKILI